ncbi:uncharacterized protein LOC116158758 [Photinus pyralis]|uniref:uncharacterized protein LOC116158758 n=1 Tax=Photinus pyralis TaxID=7054 RepID=UPI00126765B6|nr:uncharacterized protein LOC116158758 [Photinus pyralis]
MSGSSCSKVKQFVWTPDVTTVLIHLYEEHPCLYLTSCNSYKNKNVRNAAYNSITAELNKNLNKSLTVKDVQTKLHDLRTQYLSELGKIKKSKVSGTSSDEVYTPKWQYFEILAFIGQSTVVTEGESNIPASISGVPDSERETWSQSQYTEETYYTEGDGEQMETQENLEVVFDGTVAELNESEIVVENPTQVPPRASSAPPTTRMKQNKQKNTGFGELLASATKALDKIQTTSTAPKMPERLPGDNILFEQMIASEMDKIKDEEILDNLKMAIYSSLLNAKKEFRRSLRD